MKWYKIKYGFDNQEFIRIDESEVEKAMYAQLKGIVGIFKGGTVRGQNIISITPDFHKAMGWNDGYELLAEDFAELRRYNVENEHRQFLEETKDKIHHLIATKQENLIGKPVQEMKQLNA